VHPRTPAGTNTGPTDTAEAVLPHLVIGPPSEQLLRRQTLAPSDFTDRIAARHNLPDDPYLLFMKPVHRLPTPEPLRALLLILI
jgi:hypothetical protein